MKKTLLFFPLLMLITSCDDSIEARIKKEFKQYVKESYDDPKAFKEIISIELTDSTSFDKWIQVTKQQLVLLDEIWTIIDENRSPSETLEALTKKANRMKRQDQLEVFRIGIDMVDNLQKSSKLRALNLDLTYKTNDVIAELDSIPDIVIYDYVIKVRNKLYDGLKIEDYYCSFYENTGNIIIRNRPMMLNELPDEYEDIIKCTKDLSGLTEENMELAKRCVDNSSKLSAINAKY